MKLILRLTRSAFQAVRLLAEIATELKDNRRPPREEVWLDNVQAASYLNVSIRTIYTYKINGTLKAYRIGRRDYYRQSDIFRMKQS
ncbi:helix-turn-helix domain-containing protein [Pararcticibacter amylolyticus]|uniref:Helix-turn-helix domain-containing protein n=1 Tax=Pararcticibacter amylolyticus TaxID=2173175 RepID=A0A2U2PGY3_9SPHI|nr:helix-turn-helix domain-containing protein [Pararcticibacter amylolyticus]PWG80677.1 hypothetical protein DDR33_11700 [Pararcticibacter amylolyticus]